MPAEIEVRTVKPKKHNQFVERMLAFRLSGRPRLCDAATGTMVTFSTGAEIGGACYVPGKLLDVKTTAIIGLFYILPEHRIHEADALGALERRLVDNGAQIVLATTSTDGFRGTLRQWGYAPVGKGYLMKELST